MEWAGSGYTVPVLTLFLMLIMWLLSSTWRDWPEVQTQAQRSNRSLQGTMEVHQWKKFLQSNNNKTNLATFLLKEWGKEQSRTRLSEKVLYTTSKDQCYKLTQHGVHKVTDLSSTQEEADTRRLLHACHGSRTGHKSVILVSDDTDVLVISLATSDTLTCDLFLTGTKNRPS